MTGCLPCALAEGGAGEAMVVAVAVIELDASRLTTETVPDALMMDAEPAPSLLTVAVAVGGAGVHQREECETTPRTIRQSGRRRAPMRRVRHLEMAVRRAASAPREEKRRPCGAKTTAASNKIPRKGHPAIC